MSQTVQCVESESQFGLEKSLKYQPLPRCYETHGRFDSPKYARSVRLS